MTDSQAFFLRRFVKHPMPIHAGPLIQNQALHNALPHVQEKTISTCLHPFGPFRRANLLHSSFCLWSRRWREFAVHFLARMHSFKRAVHAINLNVIGEEIRPAQNGRSVQQKHAKATNRKQSEKSLWAGSRRPKRKWAHELTKKPLC